MVVVARSVLYLHGEVCEPAELLGVDGRVEAADVAEHEGDDGGRDGRGAVAAHGGHRCQQAGAGSALAAVLQSWEDGAGLA